MVSALIAAVVLSPPPSGLARLEGAYSGPMDFRDDKLGKDRSFPVDLTVTMDAKTGETLLRWTFHYAPGKRSESREKLKVATDIKSLTSTSDEKLEFTLSNWNLFEQGKSNWFEIARSYDVEGRNCTFRRRFTLTETALISEKWLKYDSDPEYRSHKMTLNRLAPKR